MRARMRKPMGRTGRLVRLNGLDPVDSRKTDLPDYLIRRGTGIPRLYPDNPRPLRRGRRRLFRMHTVKYSTGRTPGELPPPGNKRGEGKITWQWKNGYGDMVVISMEAFIRINFLKVKFMINAKKPSWKQSQQKTV
jgi:hypothetical protein